MADILISHARADAETARTVAATLEGMGWTVTCQTDSPLFGAAATEAEAERNAAEVIVALWSRHATHSRAVLKTAAAGLEKSNLVQVRLDEARVPRPFGQFPIATLGSTPPETEDAEWQSVVNAVEALTAGEIERLPIAGPVDNMRTSAADRPFGSPGTWVAAALASVVFLMFVFMLLPGGDSNEGDSAHRVAKLDTIGFDNFTLGAGNAAHHRTIANTLGGDKAVVSQLEDTSTYLRIVGYDSTACSSTLYVKRGNWSYGEPQVLGVKIDWTKLSPARIEKESGHAAIALTGETSTAISSTPWQPRAHNFAPRWLTGGNKHFVAQVDQRQDLGQLALTTLESSPALQTAIEGLRRNCRK